MGSDALLTSSRLGALVLRSACTVLRLSNKALRCSLLALLAILEPFVRVLLAGTAILTVVVAGFLKFFTSLNDVPFWGMLTMSIGCVLLLMLYYRLIQWLSFR